MLAAGEQFGAGGAHPAERILIEFVSANPTGPLVAASGRHAAYGDALARILEHHGHTVSREYYFNDAGNQIRLLGESVRARARGEEVPEGGYQGEYVAELAAEIPGAADPRPSSSRRSAVELMLARIKATLDPLRRPISTRSSASGRCTRARRAQVRAGAVEARGAGHIYRSEGAVWLRTTTFGDDKDRVVLRSNGEPTYLAADVAYLQNKRERGFERQLLPVGADHHAYARELQRRDGGARRRSRHARGADAAVRPPRRGRASGAAMSKRRGEFVTLDDLLDEIGVDATRFFMLQRSHDRTLDLDLELARQQSAENPVYYVQYAHARIASMLGRLPAGRVEQAVASEPTGRRDAASVRARPDQEADRAPRRDRRGGGAPRAAPDRRLRARARAGVHRVLPRLPGGRGDARVRRVVPDRAVGRGAADDRAVAGAARGERAGVDVGAGPLVLVEAREVFLEPARVGGVERRSGRAARSRSPRRSGAASPASGA